MSQHVCFMHISHGPVEDACFAELTKRKREDLLLAMTNENCQCICTFRGAARGLARLKSPKAFGLLERLLPHDTNPVFYTEAAESLATLGDVRSVPLLIETMAPNFKEADRQRPELDASFMGDAPLLNRLRCAIALASFDTPESTKALEAGLKNPDLALHCLTGLYVQHKTPEHLASLKKQATALTRDELAKGGWLIIDCLSHQGAEAEAVAKELESKLKEKP